MANKKFVSGIDAVGIPLLQLRIENLATAPTTLGVGHTYFDTTLGSQLFWDGTVYRNPRSRADHTGTQLATTISNFDTQVRTSRLDQMAPPAANIPMGGFTLTGLPAPTGAGQPAEASWVTTQIQSAEAGISSKDPVAALSATNIATLSGFQTIDGVTFAAGGANLRVLLVGQTSAAQNGVWNQSATAWTRSAVEGSTAELDPGAQWLVLGGTTYGGTQWRQQTLAPVTVGTTAIAIVQTGVSQTYSAGNGITLVGATFSFNPLAGGGLSASSSGAFIDTAVVARKFATTIGDGTSTSISVTHGLATKNIVASVRFAATDEFADVACVATSTTVATFNFASAPASNSLIATVLA